jgi:hypothetical protein
MKINCMAFLILLAITFSLILSINTFAVLLNNKSEFKNFHNIGLHTNELRSYSIKSNNGSNNKIFLSEKPSPGSNSSSDKKVEDIKNEEQNDNSQSSKPAVEKTPIETTAVQYCQGKYKKMSGTGFEFITVRCPSVENTCMCDLDVKGFREWVNCGGNRKPSSKGSDFVDCKSVIVGN